MSDLSSEVRRSLAELHRVCASCGVNLRSAGELVESDAVSTRLLQHAEVWEECAARLSVLVPNGVEPPRIEAGVLASLRRTWLRIKSAVGDTRAIAADCERREADARAQIEAVLKTPLPADIKEIVEQILARTRDFPERR